MTDLQALINDTDDEALLMQVLETINQKADFDISQIPDEHRHVVAAVTAQAIIDNGGFRYFFTSHFKGRPDYQMIVEAYSKIGAKESADAINQALMMFPDGAPPEELDERERYIDSIFGKDSQHAKQLGEIESKVSGKMENYSLAANYVRENADKFVM
jgi:hypothetical protein